MAPVMYTPSLMSLSTFIWSHVFFFLFILYCRCLYFSEDCCALQIKNSGAVLSSSGNWDIFLFSSYILTWSSKRCLWSCNFKRQFPAFCFDYAMKDHELCVFADIPRWTRSPLQSVLLVAALLLKSCMQALVQFRCSFILLWIYGL